jgi:hypothetical protein
MAWWLSSLGDAVGAVFCVIAVIANFLDPRHKELETQQ